MPNIYGYRVVNKSCMTRPKGKSSSSTMITCLDGGIKMLLTMATSWIDALPGVFSIWMASHSSHFLLSPCLSAVLFYPFFFHFVETRPQPNPPNNKPGDGKAFHLWFHMTNGVSLSIQTQKKRCLGEVFTDTYLFLIASSMLFSKVHCSTPDARNLGDG